MENILEREAVSDLLHLLSVQHKQIGWKKRCLYTNGVDQNVLEIKFYQQTDNHQIGRIAYDADNGAVLQMMYRGDFVKKPGHIVDILLDVINMEKSSRC
ncbi:hypothetical protein [Catalinimonas niigatensis]|uniref:hypothetical protein n=1 Tax=Catalinimonas niigatensis TaxID=1397264 RepID=UPI002665AC65|nr:hypothetical protein [Catalinimonas niigatensis]WPP49836.1 hypothetical protein PZB72_24495 [Catalinimonas niigatensis]